MVKHFDWEAAHKRDLVTISTVDDLWRKKIRDAKKQRKKHHQQQNIEKRKVIGAGNSCPKCRTQMRRKEHGKDWKPKENQPYFFKWWDVCPKCRHVQHYEVAKRYIEAKRTEPLNPVWPTHQGAHAMRRESR